VRKSCSQWQTNAFSKRSCRGPIPVIDVAGRKLPILCLVICAVHLSLITGLSVYTAPNGVEHESAAVGSFMLQPGAVLSPGCEELGFWP
jgi:hypothetical protein